MDDDSFELRCFCDEVKLPHINETVYVEPKSNDVNGYFHTFDICFED